MKALLLSIALISAPNLSAWAQRPLNHKWRAERPFELIQIRNFEVKTGLAPSDSTRDTLVLLDVTAHWCTFCPDVEKQVIRAKAKLGRRVQVYQFDFDDRGSELARRFGGISTSVPGLTLFKNGIPIGKVDGFDKDLNLADWILKREAIQEHDQVRIVTRETYGELKSIRGSSVLILYWNGVHMWGEENRAKAHEAKKQLGDQLQIFQYWSHSYTDEDYQAELKFLKEHGWSDSPDLGLSIILVHNGKIRARYEGQEFKGDLANWIQNKVKLSPTNKK